MDLGERLEQEGLRLRGTRRLTDAEQQRDHRNLYYSDNTEYKYAYEVGVYVEVDQALVNKKQGSETATAQYIEELFAGMNMIYEKEVDTHLVITGIAFVNRYDDDDDTSKALATQRAQLTGSNWPSTNPPTNLVHAILGSSLGGGVAYVGVVCNQNYGLGISAAIAGDYDIDFPKAMVWDISVVAHGKNLTFWSLRIEVRVYFLLMLPRGSSIEKISHRGYPPFSLTPLQKSATTSIRATRTISIATMSR